MTDLSNLPQEDARAKRRRNPEPRPMPANTWVVSDHEFYRHCTLAEAEAEALRLIAKHPEKTFRIYRVKRSVSDVRSSVLVDDLLSALDDCLAVVLAAYPQAGEGEPADCYTAEMKPICPECQELGCLSVKVHAARAAIAKAKG